jgi:hypothetical protein
MIFKLNYVVFPVLKKVSVILEDSNSPIVISDSRRVFIVVHAAEDDAAFDSVSPE